MFLHIWTWQGQRHPGMSGERDDLRVSLAVRTVRLQLTSGDDQGWAFIWDYNGRVEQVYYDTMVARWNYNTNLTLENSRKQDEANFIEAHFDRQAAQIASSFDWQNFNNATLKRLFRKITLLGTAVNHIEQAREAREYNNLLTEMRLIYSTGKVCEYHNPSSCLVLKPDLSDCLADSRDYDRLRFCWEGWRDAVGRQLKDKYPRFVELSNDAVRQGVPYWEDTGAYWRSWYETADFQEQLENLYNQLTPLYNNLHAYVRKKLRATYGQDKISATGPIPAHLLGNMWSQSWANIYKLVEPYPGKTSIDVTAKMLSDGWTADRMFRTSGDFLKAMGLIEMPQNFWDNSMFVKPADREVVCHASAWDFYNAHDVRIMMCSNVSMQDLITIHHEMGHIEYYLQYKHHPVPFRQGGNPGFHEAVGDLLALSVATPTHLQGIGLLDNVEDDNESDINFLMNMALDKIAFLPFAYLMDQWRWAVFNGSITPATYNQEWWKLRRPVLSKFDYFGGLTTYAHRIAWTFSLTGQSKNLGLRTELRCTRLKEAIYIRALQPSLNRDGGRYRRSATYDPLLTESPTQQISYYSNRTRYQGIVPPVPRNHDKDFDPGCKYHIAANYPYIRYFVSSVLQFQFHQALCETSGHTGPLHKCDISAGTQAHRAATGQKLARMLQMGSSQEWPDAMEVITGQRTMSAQPIVEHFQPLITWLETQNAGETLGWDESWTPPYDCDAADGFTCADGSGCVRPGDRCDGVTDCADKSDELNCSIDPTGGVVVSVVTDFVSTVVCVWMALLISATTKYLNRKFTNRAAILYVVGNVRYGRQELSVAARLPKRDRKLSDHNRKGYRTFPTALPDIPDYIRWPPAVRKLRTSYASQSFCVSFVNAGIRTAHAPPGSVRSVVLSMPKTTLQFNSELNSTRAPLTTRRRDLIVRTPRGTPPVAGIPPGHISYVTDQMNRIKTMPARLLNPAGASRGYIPDGHRPLPRIGSPSGLRPSGDPTRGRAALSTYEKESGKVKHTALPAD
ncbi:hypothetical protein Bbelb_079810 [Branchiostoma belcheri]|nr:hypothetical protein Bbelb_079810 [Branchiostoma belcheri]